MEVGVRELRNNLSRYLERVREGEEVIVTDRGKAVARMLPMKEERTIDRLIREGKVTPAKNPDRTLPKSRRLRVKGTVSEFVIEQRRW